MGLVHRWKEKRRIRLGRKSYKRRKFSFAGLRASNAFPFIQLASILAGVAVLALIVIFVVIPLFSGSGAQKIENAPNAFEDPLEGDTVKQQENDLSGLQNEAVIAYNTINNAYMDGDEIVFSSASVKNGLPVYNKLVVYNAVQKKSTEITNIRVKYENIIWCKINANYIVWLDSSSKGGGRIMMYDRADKKSYLIKEYAYALPQISMNGDYIAFMQQAGDKLDRLYLFNLKTRESVAVKVYSNLPSMTGAVHMSEGGITYSVPYIENDVQKCKIYVQPIDGSPEKVYDVGRYAYSPKMDGDYIAFLSSASGPPRDIYLFENGDTPKKIESDVVDFDMGKGFLAYTKENNIYIYVFANGQKYRLNTGISRGMLASVSGNRVCWYDVTGGTSDVDVVKYAKASW